ncbi:MAG: helix-turn-helix domain-containing protein [Clostridia bacterium]|nr:helix-turn-helix domain-containing protein [Clostridia bacterium]
MDIKQFVLSYYKNATQNFYIEKLSHPTEAQKPHKHPYYQVYFMLKGIIKHYVKNENATLIAGDVFIVPPSIPHYIRVCDKNSEFYTLSFMPEFIATSEKDNKLILDFLYYLNSATKDNILPKFSIPHADQVFCQSVLYRISNEFNGNNTGKEELIKAYVNTLLSLFARYYFQQKQTDISFELNRTSILHCLEYIKNHLDENVTLIDMAKKSAMSKSNFCKVFRSVSGKSFNNFMNEYRIEKAKELIILNEKLTTVCRICGYNDFSTFYRNFKKYTGISPTEFKKNTK